MPKNFGLGVTVHPSSSPRGRAAMVRLGRRELWLRLDRNMVSWGRAAGGARAARRVPRPRPQ
ncbi:MAG: hypothetical protein IRZ08_18945 [Frankia sp.]|nr:hypothetical protein [Frankia sp.]